MDRRELELVLLLLASASGILAAVFDRWMFVVSSEPRSRGRLFS